jgi:Tfp pilus assembly protein FimT
VKRGLGLSALAVLLAIGCAVFGSLSPEEKATAEAAAVKAAFAAARTECHRYEGTGGKRDQRANQLCLALMLGDGATTIELEPADAGTEQ